MSLGRVPFLEAWEVAKSFSCVNQVCPCSKTFTAEIEQRQVHVMSNEYAIMGGRIKKDGVSCREGFGGRDFALGKMPP